jgi:hypothetical protein
MARTFLYQYQNAGIPGGPKPHIEHDCDDCVPIPSIGDMLTSRGQQWRVDSVLYTRTILPTRSHSFFAAPDGIPHHSDAANSFHLN